MSSNKASSQKVVIGLVGLAVLALILVPRFMPGATHEAHGTITYLDPAKRGVSVEVIDPANGTTREFSGVASTECAITINGNPATFADLRVDDAIQVRARIEHGARGPEGKHEKRLMAERIDATRPEGGAR